MVVKMMIATAIAMASRTMPLMPIAVGRRRTRPVVSAASDRMEMKAAPINPEWIIEGDPQARMADHSRSGDRAAYTALWDCTAGTFRWFFMWDETVHIIEGDVLVVGSKEDPIRAVEDWTWRSPTYRLLVLEELKR